MHLRYLLSAVCVRRPDRDKIFEIGLVELRAGYFLVSRPSIVLSPPMEALADTSLLIPCSEGIPARQHSPALKKRLLTGFVR